MALHWSFYCNFRDLKGDNRNALALFDKYGVDVVISGHNYSDYYTTYPVNNGAVTTKEVTKEGDVEYYTNPGGTIYMQNSSSGLGGDLRTRLGSGSPSYNYPELLRDAEDGNTPSFVVFRVEGNKLTVDRYYLDGTTVKRYANGQFGIIK